MTISHFHHHSIRIKSAGDSLRFVSSDTVLFKNLGHITPHELAAYQQEKTNKKLGKFAFPDRHYPPQQQRTNPKIKTRVQEMSSNSNNHSVSAQVVSATPEMCAICFDAIIISLNSTKQQHNSSVEMARRNGKATTTTLTRINGSGGGASSTTNGTLNGVNRNGNNGNVSAVSASQQQPLMLAVLDDPDALNSELYRRCFPLFVTWKKLFRASSSSSSTSGSGGGEYHLRGCIGTFSHEVPLCESLVDYARTSAFEDRRFEAISTSELKHLRCSVSLLIDFEEVNNVYDWTIGVHGIRITFPSDPNASQYSKLLSGTFLPEVCAEQEWTKEECLQALYRKAGYKSAITKSLMRKTKLVRYKSSKCHMTFDEYQQCVSNKLEQTGSGEEE